MNRKKVPDSEQREQVECDAQEDGWQINSGYATLKVSSDVATLKRRLKNDYSLITMRLIVDKVYAKNEIVIANRIHERKVAKSVGIKILKRVAAYLAEWEQGEIKKFTTFLLPPPRK